MSVGTVISYPAPAFQNLPINAQYYQPSTFVISNISLGCVTNVTTVLNHNFYLGQEVRLNIPSSFGCTQLNGQTGFVLSIPISNQVTLNINSMGVSSYKNSTNQTVSAQISAIGDINSGAINANGPTQQINFINGSFINISPE